MNRDEKKQLIADLKESFGSSSIVLVAHYKGLTVAEMTALRIKVRDIGAGFQVAKNTLVRLALTGSTFEQIDNLFTGPTAIAYSSDPVTIAKVLTEFAKSNEKLILLGGAFGATFLDGAAVTELSKLPSLDELRAKIIGLLGAPASRIASILQAPGGQVARVIGAHSRKDAA
ncbi:MAG: 50S ribosomal protein L10 [Pseudomonadota bacterium]